MRSCSQKQKKPRSFRRFTAELRHGQNADQRQLFCQLSLSLASGNTHADETKRELGSGNRPQMAAGSSCLQPDPVVMWIGNLYVHVSILSWHFSPFTTCQKQLNMFVFSARTLPYSYTYLHSTYIYN